MTDFEEIILFHLKKYPLMTAQDAVKLCYQSAFGCGHLVNNKDSALSMLKKEMEEIVTDCDAQLFEPIGNGYVRLDLHRAKFDKLDIEKIRDVFIKSANEGHKTDIEPKIELLKKLAEKGKTPFSKEELSDYLSAYNGEMVRHSKKYREAYNPSYRVILESVSKSLQ